MTRVLLLLTVLGTCDLDYWRYSGIDHYWPKHWLPYVHGAGAAPEQYRVGVKLTAWWFVRHFGWGFRHGFGLMDLIATFAAVFLLYNLLEKKSEVRQASAEARWFASAAFVMLVCFYLAWVGSFFRPETLPSAGFAALMFWLWNPRGLRPSSGRRQAAIACGLIVAAGLQAWIRADVACLLNFGIFCVSLTSLGHTFSLSKGLAIVVSGLSALLAAGIQLYLMLHLYPNATYGSTHVFMARYDLARLSIWVPFVLFMVPIFWTGVQFWRRRRSMDGPSTGLVLGSGLYLILWIVMGKLDEVRIFIPFALALAPLTVELAVRRIRGWDAGNSGEAEVSV